MTKVSYRIESKAPALRGWNYLWCKKVEGFNTGVHCARCLIGHYENRFGLKAPLNHDVALDGYREGDLLYFCGVAKPYKWANNAHLAGRVVEGKVSSIDLFTSDKLIVTGFKAIAIDAKPAQKRFPTRNASFLTCRNFQFAAQMFPERQASFAA